MIPSLIDQGGLLGTVVQFVITSVISLQIYCWLLLFHLSYYSLTYRIRALVSFIDQGNKFKNSDNKSNELVHYSLSELPFHNNQMKRQLRTCAYIFDKLCLAANELNATFSPSVLIILTLQMIISASSVFFCISAISSVLRSMIYFFALLFVTSVVTIVILLNSAESPIIEV